MSGFAYRFVRAEPDLLGMYMKAGTNHKTIDFFEIIPIINPRVRAYCKLPYPGHHGGCPNFGKRTICPPQAPRFDKLIDMAKPIYCIYYKFDLRAHAQKLRIKHTDWSERKLRCCLYWQNTARKQLRLKTESFLRDHPDYTILTCPEGNGVDIDATVKQVGIELQWPAIDYAYKIALAGIPRNGADNAP